MSLQRDSDQMKESKQKKENENQKDVEKKPRKMRSLRENQRESKRISIQEQVR